MGQSPARTNRFDLDPAWYHICKGDFMAHQHPPRFLKIVDDAKTRVRETNVDEVKKRLDRRDKFILVDVREESEYAKDHLPGAIYLGKGVIERDIEARVPELSAEMILYCGGGFRSALAADNLQKMGYTNVISMDGGIRGWREKGYPLTTGSVEPSTSRH
jgi:rhodanese-related sulfurtransferase